MSDADRLIAPAPSAGESGPRVDLPLLIRLAAITLVLTMAGLAFYRAQKRAPDWNHWEEETYYLRMNGRIADGTSMYGYLPGAFFLVTAFTIWPRDVGGAMFAASNVLCVLAAAWAVRRWWLGRSGSFTLAAAALLVCGVSVADPFWANQLSLWILGLAVVGLAWVQRGYGFAGGLLLGAATVVKPIPGLLVAFCAWKRHWAAVAGAAVAGFALDIVPTVAFFGWYAAAESDPATADRPPLVRGVIRTVEAHLDWMHKAQDFGAYWCIEDPLYYRRSQGPPAVLARWLRAMPDSDHHLLVRDEHPTFAADGRQQMSDGAREGVAWKSGELGGRVSVTLLPGPPQGPYRSPGPEITHIRLDEIPRLNMADLSADAVRMIYRVLMLAVIALLLWQTRGAGARLNDDTWFAQAAVWMLAMFWFSPILSHNYLIWAYPAAALLLTRLWVADREPPARRLIIAALGLWLLGQCFRAYGPAEFYGLNLIGTVALGVPLLLWPARPAAADTNHPTKA